MGAAHKEGSGVIARGSISLGFGGNAVKAAHAVFAGDAFNHLAAAVGELKMHRMVFRQLLRRIKEHKG